MMSFLLGLLLGPFFPQLADPQLTYSNQLSVVVQQLEKDSAPPTQAEIDAVANAQAKADQEDEQGVQVKPINGRLLQDLIAPKRLAAANDSSGVEDSQPQNPLVLTGVLRVGHELVAILNNGSEDFVVAKGSYVLKSMQVVDVKGTSVQLRSINKDRTGQITELQLSGESVSGGTQ